MFRTANENAQPNYALLFGVATAMFLGAAYMVDKQKKSAARGRVKTPAPPALAYNLSVADLRGGESVLEFRVGQQAKVSAPAQPGAGIVWHWGLEGTGPEGNPVAVRQSQDAPAMPGAAATQTFILTGAREGTATIILTARNPQNEIVDSVRFHVEITE